ncbi:MAG TPA: hypothetical protein VFT95_04885, partial [Micromonosporaceae bacterium]|nr:hypothetical protein [Micromonosporaceae bacterium]
MSYQQQGFPQQAQNLDQGGQAPAPARTNPATAIIAAVLALGAAVALTIVGFDFLNAIPEGASFGDLPAELKT